jgi:hypothetical protein
MQRAELAARIPEAVRQRIEFRQLAAVGIGRQLRGHAHHPHMLTFPDA